jgi:hypothetical protein
MTDIVEILRTWPVGERVNVNIMAEAADEIDRLRGYAERLESQIERLHSYIAQRARLKPPPPSDND